FPLHCGRSGKDVGVVLPKNEAFAIIGRGCRRLRIRGRGQGVQEEPFPQAANGRLCEGRKTETHATSRVEPCHARRGKELSSGFCEIQRQFHTLVNCERQRALQSHPALAHVENLVEILQLTRQSVADTCIRRHVHFL